MKNQDQSFTRLLKKLSALRATLNNDERSLLDGLVTSSVSEVSAHSMRVVPISPAKSAAKATSPDEAKANAMKVSTAKSAAKSASPDEARANSMSFQIIFNAGKDEYQLKR